MVKQVSVFSPPDGCWGIRTCPFGEGYRESQCPRASSQEGRWCRSPAAKKREIADPSPPPAVIGGPSPPPSSLYSTTPNPKTTKGGKVAPQQAQSTSCPAAAQGLTEDDSWIDGGGSTWSTRELSKLVGAPAQIDLERTLANGPSR